MLGPHLPAVREVVEYAPGKRAEVLASFSCDYNAGSHGRLFGRLFVHDAAAKLYLILGVWTDGSYWKLGVAGHGSAQDLLQSFNQEITRVLLSEGSS